MIPFSKKKRTKVLSMLIDLNTIYIYKKETDLHLSVQTDKLKKQEISINKKKKKTEIKVSMVQGRNKIIRRNTERR